ncbi:MAG: efflux RND transporter periplasmic adaptor subunit [Proteobacteria bacterium]|nr:MAG: efflux RND transporter periplasmic adaptor subunit [Pseudomonadota bacterium]
MCRSAAAQDETYQGLYDCLLEPHREVALGFSVSGIVKEIAVDRGDAVKKGQAVARLSSELEGVGIELARAKVDFARRKVARSQELLKDEFVSEYDVDEAVTELRLAELEAQQAEAAMRLRSLFSPVSGIVVERSLSAGEFVSEEDVMRVVQIHPLNVEVVVPVDEFGTVREGMIAVVHLEKPIGGEHEATVTIVDKVIDAASGTFGVRLEMPNEDLAIPAGLKCRVEFPLAE